MLWILNAGLKKLGKVVMPGHTGVVWLKMVTSPFVKTFSWSSWTKLGNQRSCEVVWLMAMWRKWV